MGPGPAAGLGKPRTSPGTSWPQDGHCRAQGLKAARVAGRLAGAGCLGAASAFRAASSMNKRGRRPALGSGDTRPLGAGCWPRHGARGSQQGPLPSTGTDPAVRGAAGLASGASRTRVAFCRAAGPSCAAQMSCRRPGAPGCRLSSPRLPKGTGGSLLPAPHVLEGKLPSLSTAAAPCAVPPPGTGSWGGSWGSLRAAGPSRAQEQGRPGWCPPAEQRGFLSCCSVVRPNWADLLHEITKIYSQSFGSGTAPSCFMDCADIFGCTKCARLVVI